MNNSIVEIYFSVFENTSIMLIIQDLIMLILRYLLQILWILSAIYAIFYIIFVALKIGNWVSIITILLLLMI